MASDTHITTTPTTGTPTVTKGQINAIRTGIRAAASSNPQGIEHGLRCAEITQSVCADFGAGSLSGIRADCFPAVMRAVAEMAVPKRRQGQAEAALRDAGARLGAVLADLNRTRQGIARFRHEAEAALLAPLKSALGVDGRGTLEAVVQDGAGYLLSMPLLQLEHELDRAHEVLAVLGARLPAIGRALDERGAE
jgi:hypothetical protein